MMFSATFPKSARELARQFLAGDHVQVRVGRPGSTHANIRQQVPDLVASPSLSDRGPSALGGDERDRNG